MKTRPSLGMGRWRGHRPAGARAFSLVELLVVLAIVSLLAALLLPVLARARVRAQGVVCAGQLRQLGIAVRLYATDHVDFLPRSQHSAFAHKERPWGSALAPYLGGSTESWTQLLATVYHCPSDSRVGAWSYGINVYFELGPEDDYEGKPQTWRRFGSVTRPSRTILFAENRSQADHLMPNFWARPEDAVEVAHQRHAGRANYLFVDGHTERTSLETTYSPVQGVDLWHPGR